MLYVVHVMLYVEFKEDSGGHAHKFWLDLNTFQTWKYLTCLTKKICHVILEQ